MELIFSWREIENKQKIFMYILSEKSFGEREAEKWDAEVPGCCSVPCSGEGWRMPVETIGTVMLIPFMVKFSI